MNTPPVGTSSRAADLAAIEEMATALKQAMTTGETLATQPAGTQNKPITDTDRVEDPWADRPPVHTATSKGAQAALRGKVVVAGQRAPKGTPTSKESKVGGSSDVVDPYAKQPAPTRPALRYNPPSGL